MLKDYIVLDIETTGFDKEVNEIIEIGAIKVVNNSCVDRFNELVHIEGIVPYNITELTGITDTMLANARNCSDVLKDFISFCEDFVLIGHNIIVFDYPFLCIKSKQLGLKAIGYDITKNGLRKGIDTLVLARKYYPGVSHNLGNLADYLKIEVDTNKFHRALYDVEVCNLLYQLMQKQFGVNLDVITPECFELTEQSKKGIAVKQDTFAFE